VVYLAGRNRTMLWTGVALGAAAGYGKATLDQLHCQRQAVASATYKVTLRTATQLAAQAAAAKEPKTRQALLALARGRLDGLKEANYTGLVEPLRQRFQSQHQLVEAWFEQATAAEKENDLTRTFVLGAARAGEFGMKEWPTPNLSPPSARNAVATGVVVGATAAALVAAGRLAARRQQRATLPPLKPVRHSSLVSAAGYDRAARTLALTFKSSGNSYLYQNVPADVAQEFLAADKKGALFHQKIKGAYPARRMEKAG
jgi:hypothetical protein